MAKKSFIDRWEEQEQLNFYDYMYSREGYIDFIAALNHVVNFQKKITAEELSKESGYAVKTIENIMSGCGQRYSKKNYEMAFACGYSVNNFYKLGNLITKGVYDPTADNIPTLEDDPRTNLKTKRRPYLTSFKIPLLPMRFWRDC